MPGTVDSRCSVPNCPVMVTVWSQRGASHTNHYWLSGDVSRLPATSVRCSRNTCSPLLLAQKHARCRHTHKILILRLNRRNRATLRTWRTLMTDHPGHHLLWSGSVVRVKQFFRYLRVNIAARRHSALRSVRYRRTGRSAQGGFFGVLSSWGSLDGWPNHKRRPPRVRPCITARTSVIIESSISHMTIKQLPESTVEQKPVMDGWTNTELKEPQQQTWPFKAREYTSVT